MSEPQPVISRLTGGRLAVFNSRRAWLRWRSSRLCASDVPGVLGLSPWTSNVEVWANKCHRLDLADAVDVESDKMRYGRHAEAMIGPMFHEDTDLYVATPQLCVTHETMPWCGASLDALVFDSNTYAGPVREVLAEHGVGVLDAALGVCEMKTEGISGATWDESGIPDHYWVQVQWQLHVTGLQRAWLAVLHGWRFKVYVVERDQRDIDEIVQRCSHFWHEHVVTGRRPDVIDGSESTLRTLAALYPHERPMSSVELDSLLVQAWQKAKADLAVAKERVDYRRALIEAALGDHHIGTVEGTPVLQWQAGEQRRVDTAAMPKWARYRWQRTIPTRTLRAVTKETRRLYDQAQDHTG